MTNFRIGYGYDVHALAPELPMIIGGITIPHHKGFVAHSDGDVLIHALCDALLGAAALGDIGVHFPDNNEEFRGLDSSKLLTRCIGMVREQGYDLGNADCTVAMQLPKLRPYIEAMRGKLAQALGVEISRISVKATTTEKLGFVGREEGVEASAIVLIYKK